MTIRLCFYLVGVALYICSQDSMAGTTIRFEPGPYGGERVSTPWGDYIVLQEGNSIWVGTEDEYDHSRVVALAQKDGMKEMVSTDNGGGRYFYDVALPSVPVGNNQVVGIDTTILFGMGPDKKLQRPAKPHGAEYVSFIWTQSAKGKISATVLDLEKHEAYKSYSCQQTDGWHTCEMIMPTEALKHRAAILFTRPKMKPGYLPADSIALLHYKSIENHIKSLKHDGISVNPDDPDDDSFRYLKRLHEIDPGIPEAIQ